jgi:hypothetical protein
LQYESHDQAVLFGLVRSLWFWLVLRGRPGSLDECAEGSKLTGHHYRLGIQGLSLRPWMLHRWHECAPQSEGTEPRRASSEKPNKQHVCEKSVRQTRDNAGRDQMLQLACPFVVPGDGSTLVRGMDTSGLHHLLVNKPCFCECRCRSDVWFRCMYAIRI